MKKILVLAGVVIAAGIAVAAYEVATVTDPYVIKAMAATPAPDGAKVGHTVNTSTHALSVYSSNAVVVVADPGVSFQYEELWLVEKPREDKSNNLIEYRFELPKYAATKHINPLGSSVPPKILKVAAGNQWR